MPQPESDSDEMDIEESIVENQLSQGGGPGGPEDGDLTNIYASQYEQLQNIQQENAFSIQAVEDVTNVLQQSTLLVQREKKLRESVLGGNVLLMCAQISQRQALSLDTNLCSFDLQSFADGILNHCGLARTGRVDFNLLAKVTHKMFKRSPAMTYMYGSFKPTALPPKEIKERARRTNRAAGEKREPEKVTTVQASEEGNDKAVQHLKRVLRYLIRSNGGKPLDFFQTIVHPHSFHHTVENIFHLSFLMKNNLFSVTLGRDGLPVINMVAKRQNQDKEKEKKNQCIVSISPQKWKELIDVFKIREPMIPPLA